MKSWRYKKRTDLFLLLNIVVLLGVWSPLLVNAQGVIVTEIMYDPNKNSSNEYIELYNAGDKPVSLQGLMLSGSVGSSSAILSVHQKNGSDVLMPHAYALVFSQSYFDSPFYDIPEDVLLLMASKGLSLNNTGDVISLGYESGRMLVSLTYIGQSGRKGRSLEKIVLTSEDSPSNYAYSLYDNGSPGTRNSVTPYQYDLSVSTSPLVAAYPQEMLTIVVIVSNEGTTFFSESVSIRLYYDKTMDGQFDLNESIYEFHIISPILKGESKQQEISLPLPDQRDSMSFAIILNVPSDENALNDTVYFSSVLSAAYQDVVINEILYEPVQDKDDFKPDQSEFIELYNQSDRVVNLHGWVLSDQPNENGDFSRYVLSTSTNSSPFILPKSYAMVTADQANDKKDSRLFKFYDYLNDQKDTQVFLIEGLSLNLNNDGDLIKLSDAFGKTVDSVRYLPSWHSPLYASVRGLSLERRNPSLASHDKRSWTTCTEKTYGATPFRINHAWIPFTTSLEDSDRGSFKISPNPFSPDGDGYEDALSIQYHLSSESSQLRIRVFDIYGRIVKEIANEPISSKGKFIWDGFGDASNILPVGLYIILCEAIDFKTGQTTSLKKSVVLARKF